MSVWAQLTRETCCIVFDTETNGLFREGCSNPRMVALAWSLFSIEKGSVKKQNFIVRADDFDPNPSGSLEHGISKARALREGVQPELILEEFKRDLSSYQPMLLIAHNIEFDIRVLKSECQRIGFDLSQELNLPKFCTMKSTTSQLAIPRGDPSGEYERRIAAYKRNHNMRTKRARRGLEYYEETLSREISSRKKWPSLQELHQHLFEEPLTNWHNALADVEACERCFRKIAEQRITELAARKKQLEVERQERDKSRAEWSKRERELMDELAQLEDRTRRVVFNAANYVFFSIILVLTIVVLPLGIFVGVCAFFGIRGDYRRAKERLHQAQLFFSQESQKYLK